MAVSSVDDTTTSTQLLAPDMARKGASIWNTSTAILYVLQGQGTASASNFSFQLAPGELWESPHENAVKGGLTGIWASNASGAAKITTW